MFDYSDWNHFLLWRLGDRSAPAKHFAGLTVDSELLSLFTNLIAAPRVWAIDQSEPTTIDLRSGDRRPGYPSGELSVSIYVVVRGSLHEGIASLEDLLGSSNGPKPLDDEGQRSLDAYSTATALRAAVTDATVLLFWARSTVTSGHPRLPTDFMLDRVRRLNRWGRSLRERATLLDSARINVNYDRKVLGPQSRQLEAAVDRLVAIGSYQSEGVDPADALRTSGLASERIIVELRTANGWWAPASDAPPYYDDPRNAIFV